MLHEIEEVQDVIEVAHHKNYRVRPKVFEIFNDKELKLRYRLSKAKLTEVIDLVREELTPQLSNRELPLSVEQQTLIAVRYLAKGAYQQDIGDLHGVSQATTSRVVGKFVRALARHYDLYIKFPTTLAELNSVREGFFGMRGMPNIIGCVDCTHIKIKNPGGEIGEHYRNRKGFFSLNCQVACDAQMRITNIVARWRGSVHDSRIWSACGLRDKFEARQINGLLLGDSGYACTNYMLTPFNNPQTPQEIRYNAAHTSTRSTIERTFGVWKSKFRALQRGLNLSLESTKAAIIAMAILYNIGVDERLETGESSDSDLSESEDDEQPDPENDPNPDIPEVPHHLQGNAFRRLYVQRHF